MTIVEALGKLRNKEISSKELFEECKKNWLEKDKELNAFITPLFGSFQEPGEGALSGIPIAVKDNICQDGVRLTCGSRILGNYKSLFDATVVRKLKDAGAVLVGKTNLDEFAMGSSGEYSTFGPTRNPLDTSLVPGGSSSGSAACVAADMALASLGSDTGGSVRQPAAFCGLVGLRPTYGTVSRYGLVAFASSVDQIGPIAKTVDDCELVYGVISGYDPKDSTSVQTQEFKFDKEQMTVGIPKELGELDIAPEIIANLEATRKILESAGVRFKEISLPSIKYSIATYQLITPSECSSNLSRFDGVRYGLQKSEDDLGSQYKSTRSAGFGDEVKRRILIGTYALSEGYFDAFYLQACRVRRKIFDELMTAYSQVTAILTPTTPTTAFPLGSVQDPLKMYACDLLTIPQGLAGVPALSVPSGKDKDNRPIGMHISGPAFSEKMLFHLGRMIEG